MIYAITLLPFTKAEGLKLKDCAVAPSSLASVAKVLM
jgi:hypothetical protein